MTKELLEKAKACTTAEALQALIKREAQGLSSEEISRLVRDCSEKFAAADENVPLTDRELSEISGGGSSVSYEPGHCTVYTFLTETENGSKVPDELDKQINTAMADKFCRNCTSAFLRKCPVGSAVVYSNYIYGVTKYTK